MIHLSDKHPHTQKSTIDVNLESEYKRFAGMTQEQIFSEFTTGENGIEADKAQELLEKNGRNIVSDEKRKPWYLFLLKSFKDEFIIVLLLLGIISIVLQDHLGATIIFILAIISGMLRFVQDYRAYLASEKLKHLIHTHVDVRRGGQTEKVDIDQIVLGDLVELGTGAIIPADLYIIQSKDLFISQSMFTGESVPVEKKSGICDTSKGSTELDNICLMGCNVVSGSGIGVVIKTGKSTYLGTIAQTVENNKGKTNFEIGLSKVTNTLVRYMILIVIGVFIINGLVKKDWLQAFMFAISVAVGITPGMLPMIVNATLAKGAQFLAKKKTIVKNISSIQNFGAMDVLCTDKTGTLTMDEVQLQRYMNIDGQDDRGILDYAFLNSYFSTGIKNLIDRAVISYGNEHGVKEDVSNYKKIDEIPFDYERKLMSVVIENEEGNHRLITKGAIEEVLKACSTARDEQKDLPITDELMKKIMSHADELNEQGMHVIAIAQKEEQFDTKTFGKADETNMTFIGYIAFLDPPKPDVADAVKEIYGAGVDIKIITGDAGLVAEKICQQVGIRKQNTLLGTELEKMTEEELKKSVETVNIFARVSPMQKQRIVDVLRINGHVVGYMGDGVNDAPSLRHADVGISVDSATDIAKESSDIILLEKSLSVLSNGIYEGRKIYGNIMKYMKMALSSNFGNVFSVLVASILLPFLPMIPIQILIQNLIYDFTQIAIPWDNVDKEFLQKPKKWDTKSLVSFMNVMGITSSIFDVCTFAVLWFILGFATVGQQTYFQTGWFMEGLISQTLIVHFIRTSKIPFIQSRADIRLLLSTAGGITAAFLIPQILHSVSSFNFALMPAQYYPWMILTILAYAVTIEIVKRFYIKKHGSWL